MKKTLSAEEEFFKALASVEEITYKEDLRAYFDQDGWVTAFTGSDYPPGDNWISIDKALYITGDWAWLRVINGKIVKQEPKYTHHFGLTKSDVGVKVVKYHASVVVESHEDYIDVEYYDSRNN